MLCCYKSSVSNGVILRECAHLVIVKLFIRKPELLILPKHFLISLCHTKKLRPGQIYDIGLDLKLAENCTKGQRDPVKLIFLRNVDTSLPFHYMYSVFLKEVYRLSV